MLPGKLYGISKVKNIINTSVLLQLHNINNTKNVGLLLVIE